MLSSHTISEIALIFVNSEDFDQQLNQSLAIIGHKLGVSRTYMFTDSEDSRFTSNTHEWCAEGFEPQKDNLQSIPYEAIPQWEKMLLSHGVVPIEDVQNLDPEIQAILKPQHVKALIIVPMVIDGRRIGFLGFDECGSMRSWSIEEVETIRILSGIIGSAFSRQRILKRLVASEENFRGFFNTVDDIMLIADFEGRVLFANQGACQKLNYALEEMVGKSILDFHPPETHPEAKRILEQMFQQQLRVCPLDLMTREGQSIPVETRIWFGEWNGQACFFGISKDLTAEQEARQKFERMFQNNPAAMAVTRVQDKVFLEVNKAFEQILGYNRSEIVGQSSSDMELFVDDEYWSYARSQLLRYGKAYNVEIQVKRKDGILIYGLFSADSLRIQQEEFYLTVMIDITEQKILQKSLFSAHQRLTHVIEGTRLGTWEWNVVTGETRFNELWARMLGYTLEELSPISIQTWESLTHPDDFKASHLQLQKHFNGESDFYEVEVRMRHKNGSWVWILDRGKVIERSESGEPLMMYGTHTDINERKRLEIQVQELAVRDSLTGIFNRRYIFDRLEGLAAETIRGRISFCLTIIDLDHFKNVNDQYGHLAGDFILKQFAQTVQKQIRPYDLFGRYGGEEFIIISPQTELQEIRGMLERLQNEFRSSVYLFEKTPIRFTVSCGVVHSSAIPNNAFSVNDLVALADQRLYQAKRNGRDCCVSESLL